MCACASNPCVIISLKKPTNQPANQKVSIQIKNDIKNFQFLSHSFFHYYIVYLGLFGLVSLFNGI